MNNKGMTFFGFLFLLIIIAFIGAAIYIYGFGFKKEIKVNKESVGAIDYGKKSKAEIAVSSYVAEIERINTLSEMDPVNYKKIETTDDITTLNIVIKGEKPESGSIVIEKDMVKSANLIVSGFKCTYDGERTTCK